jgi:hypothetical protein
VEWNDRFRFRVLSMALDTVMRMANVSVSDCLSVRAVARPFTIALTQFAVHATTPSLRKEG